VDHCVELNVTEQRIPHVTAGNCIPDVQPLAHRYRNSAVVTADVVPSSPILVTLMMEALSSSETSVLTKVTRRNISEDGILHSHRRENSQILHRINWLDSVAETLCVSCDIRAGFYIPQDDILHSHRRENLKSYIALTGWTL
jgi:hypothetical protein